MAYNPSNTKLAVGSHDNYIYLFDCANEYKPYTIFKGHSSFITCFDWSLDDQTIRSNCGAYELLFWDVKKKTQMTSGASETVSTEWATHSTKLGWAVQGISPPGTDGSHINTVAQCKELGLLATGDDYGHVNIFRDPAVDNHHKSKSFQGHSEHVTKVAFAKGGDLLLSVGGMDQTVIQWRRVVPT